MRRAIAVGAVMSSIDKARAERAKAQ